jgi:hypothetical protein
MTLQVSNQSGPPPAARRSALARIAASVLPAVPFGLCAGPLIAYHTGWAVGYSVAVGGLTGLALGLVIGAADWLGLHELLRRRGRAPVAAPVAAPEPDAALGRQPAGDLWLVMIGPPVFAGLFLCLALMATPRKGGPWGNVVIVLIVGAVLVLWATVVSPPRLRELARRGEWAPRGAAAHPYRTALALTALVMAAVVAVSYAGVWILQLCGV